MLMVEDQVELMVICNDEINVLFGGGDIVVGLFVEVCLFVVDVDEGLNDNCSIVMLQVCCNYWVDGDCDGSVESWSLWGDYVDFYCCDINQEIIIELKVMDVVGNENICW